MKSYSFPKHSRLKSHKVIAGLFAKSNAFGARPLRILWDINNGDEGYVGLKVLIAVPKRKLKRAVDRNRVKRLLRESIRQNKTEIDSFLKERNINCNLGILYTSNKVLNYETINEAMIKLLHRFKDEYEKFAE